jgi:glycerol-3-phosphate dehydrogenase
MDYGQYLHEAVPEMASRFKVAPELVSHLINCYGARTGKVLELAATDPVLGGSISPECRDIYAQVLYSVIEEGARTLSDIVLRRMHLGITASRGLNQAEKIADIAGRELRWSDDERRHQIDVFTRALNRETACLGGPERKGAS